MIVTTLLGVSSLSFLAVEKSSLLLAHRDVCGRLLTDYVKRQELATKKFVEICLEESQSDVERALAMRKHMSPKRALIEILNQRLSVIRISHLGAYAPSETLALWTGESVDTGARGRIVDGEIVVTRVLPGSAADKAGLMAGDLVVAVDGNPIQEPEELREASGFWEIIRPDETRVNVLIRAEVFQESLVPHWVESQEKKGIRVLRIPSFLPQAIESDEWSRIQDEIFEIEKRGDRLVVDIRGNGGGSFPAMLRVLSTVSCGREAIGWLYRDNPPSSSGADKSAMIMLNDVAAEPQLEILEKYNAIELKPFAQTGCFKGPIVVVVDQHTASVSEIFAQAIKERPLSFVMGWRTAGHVVMARWFQIQALSPDYTVSIPVALYRSAKGQELERLGVSPDQILTDSLKAWRSTKDPWILEATRTLRIVSK